MTTGAWVYNWIKQRVEWIERGKAYDMPQAAPSQNPQRPYHDPGKPVVNRNNGKA